MIFLAKILVIQKTQITISQQFRLQFSSSFSPSILTTPEKPPNPNSPEIPTPPTHNKTHQIHEPTRITIVHRTNPFITREHVPLNNEPDEHTRHPPTTIVTSTSETHPPRPAHVPFLFTNITFPLCVSVAGEEGVPRMKP